MSAPFHSGLFQPAFAGFAGSALLDLTCQHETGKKSHPRSFDTQPRIPHFELRANSVIYLRMQSGRSQVDRLTFGQNSLEERLTHQFETRVVSDIIA